MSKFWPNLEKALIGFFVLGIVVFFFVPNYHGGRNYLPPNVSKKKVCMSNMKTIEGALELYFMENKYQDNAVIGIKELLAKGYLKSTPRCTSLDPKSDYMTNSIKALNGTVISEVECPVHGKISLQATTDKDKGL